MKVYIGPYSHWFQPARWYKDWIFWAYGFNGDDTRIDIDKYEACRKNLSNSWVYNALRDIEVWVDSRFKRKINIKIHNYDVWGMDHTLALIILPMLKLLKKKKQGSPFVDDDDVPEHLRSTTCEPVQEWEADANTHKRWDWCIDEMIWGFEQILNDEATSQFHFDLDPAKPRDEPGISFEESMRRGGWNKEGAVAFQHRKNKALTLFGKYFEALWD